ncbi:MAG: protein tyrosine phosphatase superfamily protein [Firmicutes bacterium]|nr:protein tyrosine phosphatase superfamily protein [Bacillota bacterium]
MHLHRKYIIGFIVLIILISTAYMFLPREGILAQGETIIREDAVNKEDMPKSFRRFDDLKASGSAQYSANALHYMKDNLAQKKVVLVDLRQESHGFINGTPVSWYGDRDWANIGKNTDEVLKIENEALTDLAGKQQVSIHKDLKKDKETGALLSSKTEIVKISEVRSEEQLAQSLGMGYFRLAVTDHRRPLDNDVDLFIGFIKNLSPDTWLHFHCEAGHGRTTTFLAMYDMMSNAKNDTLEEIVDRQYKAGGINLFELHKQDWRTPYDQERIAFIKDFYAYCRQNNDHYASSWSSWLAAQE